MAKKDKAPSANMAVKLSKLTPVESLWYEKGQTVVVPRGLAMQLDEAGYGKAIECDDDARSETPMGTSPAEKPAKLSGPEARS